MSDEAQVFVSVEKGVGRILLNRPNVMNAINLDMVNTVAAALADWAQNPAVKAVWIEGAGGKAFCAGGDVVAVSKAGQEQTDLCRSFFQEEYRLNRAIHMFEKPYIAFLDGITMGGGVGLSVHGHHRVVTENTLFAMPETGIGLFPDVGGSYFLSRCPGEVGLYLGLTGARLKAADLLSIGLADHMVHAADRDAILTSLQNALASSDDLHGTVDIVLSGFAHHIPDGPILALQDEIDAAFAGNDLDAMIARLEQSESDFAATALKHLAGKSPMLLKATVEQLRRGAGLDFDPCMVMEYRMVRHALQPGSDFHEGVRALLIDKDKNPKWTPATAADVSADAVAKFFEAPPEGDLTF